MPKNIYSLKEFSGGANTAKNSSEINENELSSAQNVMFSDQGIMSPSYIMTDSTNNKVSGYNSSHISTIEAGYGLGYFETDQQVTNPTTVSDTGNGDILGTLEGFGFYSTGTKHYLVHFISGSLQNLHLSFPAGSEILITNLPASGSAASGGRGHSATVTEADEGIYKVVAVDASDKAIRLDRWMGVNPGSDDLGFTGTITGLPSGDKVLLLANPANHDIDVFSTSNSNAWAQDVIDLGTGDDTPAKVKYYKIDDAIRCCDTAGNQSKIKWYGFISRVHFAGTEDVRALSEYSSEDNDLPSPTDGDLINTSGGTLTYPTAGKGFDLKCFSSTTVEASIPGLVYEFAQSFIYDGNQESLLTKYTNATLTASDLMELSLQIGARGNYGKRVSGGRIYIRESGTSNEWIMILDINLSKGARTNFNDEYTDWKYTGADTKFFIGASATTYMSVKELSLLNYEIINGYPSSIFSIDIGREGEHWKDAIVANNRVFVCNVSIADENKGSSKDSSSLTNFKDRIMYSMPNRYDVFPYYNYIEAAKGDADHYIAIDSFADRLLAFKRFSCDIINISSPDDSAWFLEDSRKYQGVEHPEAVKKTQYGIVWVNQQGLWLYDGQKTLNLIESKISNETWRDFVSATSVIIYDEKESMVFVVKSSSDGDSYMCDLRRGSFTKIKDFAKDGITNSVDTEDGDTLVSTTGSSSDIDVYKLYRTYQSTSNIKFETKMLDFGYPANEKRIYSAYVTYKTNSGFSSMAGSLFTLNYEGDSTGTSSFSGTMGASTSWKTVKLTLSSPVTCTKASMKFDSSSNSGKLYVSDISFEFRLMKKRAG